MIKIEKPSCRHQNCESCFDASDTPIKAIRVHIPDSTSSRTMHLCGDCRKSLITALSFEASIESGGDFKTPVFEDKNDED